jgi:hypothetical protein
MTLSPQSELTLKCSTFSRTTVASLLGILIIIQSKHTLLPKFAHQPVESSELCLPELTSSCSMLQSKMRLGPDLWLSVTPTESQLQEHRMRGNKAEQREFDRTD